MKIRPIVTVMNFHALLRVDSSRKLAERHKLLENEITSLIDKIVNNRNIVLDKKILKVNQNAGELGIYFGTDFGFCGSINSEMNALLATANSKEDKIMIGTRLSSTKPSMLSMKREDFETRYSEIQDLIIETVKKQRYSKIHLYYNHYYNLSKIEPIKKCIYPFVIEEGNRNQTTDDYLIEGDFNVLLEDLAVTYLNCEIRIAAANSVASENIMRQNVTSDSLDRINEMEIEETKRDRKIKNQKAFQKVIDNYVKQRGLNNE